MENKEIQQMKAFCDKNHVTSYWVLNKYAKMRREDWLEVLCTSNGRKTMILYCRELEKKYKEE